MRCGPWSDPSASSRCSSTRRSMSAKTATPRVCTPRRAAVRSPTSPGSTIRMKLHNTPRFRLTPSNSPHAAMPGWCWTTSSRSDSYASRMTSAHHPATTSRMSAQTQERSEQGGSRADLVLIRRGLWRHRVELARGTMGWGDAEGPVGPMVGAEPGRGRSAPGLRRAVAQRSADW